MKPPDGAESTLSVSVIAASIVIAVGPMNGFVVVSIPKPFGEIFVDEAIVDEA